MLGATGFIGRWVARALTEAGAELHLLVRDPAAAERLFDEYDVRGAIHATELVDLEATRRLLRQLAPVVAFNLAGYGVDPGERREGSNRVAALLNEQVPALAAEVLAELPTRGWQGRRLVHTGSIYEYGNIGGHLDESATPAPFELYGRSKLAGTLRLARISQAHGLPALTARICQVYGAGEQAGRLLPALFAARRGREPVSLSVGTQLQDFPEVEDVADGLLRLGVTAGPPGEVVNLATGRLTSVREFVLEAAHVLQLDPGLLKFEKPLPDNELQHLEVAVERLRALTGWVPDTAVAAGIRRTLQFPDRARTR